MGRKRTNHTGTLHYTTLRCTAHPYCTLFLTSVLFQNPPPIFLMTFSSQLFSIPSLFPHLSYVHHLMFDYLCSLTLFSLSLLSLYPLSLNSLFLFSLSFSFLSLYSLSLNYLSFYSFSLYSLSFCPLSLPCSTWTMVRRVYWTSSHPQLLLGTIRQRTFFRSFYSCALHCALIRCSILLL